MEKELIGDKVETEEVEATNSAALQAVELGENGETKRGKKITDEGTHWDALSHERGAIAGRSHKTPRTSETEKGK